MKFTHLFPFSLVVVALILAGVYIHANRTSSSTISDIPALSPEVQARSLAHAEVATHSSAESCYTVVSGIVYDLTSWIDQHPGGREAILSLCGTDGTAAFEAQHGGERRPAEELASFAIGILEDK